jgi:predicted transcriptional regulator
MAFGLPVEGEEGPFAGVDLVDVAICEPDERVEDVRRRLVDQGDAQVVVTNRQGIVLGLVEPADLDRGAPDDPVAKVMSLSPTTVRPSVLASSLAERNSPVLVTDSDGTLLGVVEPRTVPESSADPEMEQLQTTFLDIAHAVEEHFEGEEPSEAEVRSFLRQRLVAEGRSSEEAEAYLSAMDEASE